MGTDLLFVFYLLPSITLELRARLPAGGLRFQFFYVVGLVWCGTTLTRSSQKQQLNISTVPHDPNLQQ